MKARYRFMEWRLTANPDAVGFTGRCVECGDASAAAPIPDEVQVWCLKHAGVSGHRVYELATVQMFAAEPNGD